MAVDRKEMARINLKEENITNVSAQDFPHFTSGLDFAWSFELFRKEFKVVVSSLNETEMEFDLIGIHSSIANALRRVMLVEVPTMAIEQVFIMKNTSVVADEILAHRLGLVPIQVDAREFDFRPANADPTDMNTIVFKLEVDCTFNKEASKDEIDPSKKYVNGSIYSRDLIWQPAGDQLTTFKNSPIKPFHDDILLAKLRPGQSIHAELHCQKGIGKEHIKWSPVATASYRLLPEIQILQPITDADAHKFQKCFPKGTIEIEKDSNGVDIAVVANPRKDTASRECLRHPEFQDKVKLNRIRDHFIFSIESVNGQKPNIIFDEAIDVLINKCKVVKAALDALGFNPEKDVEMK